MASIAFFYLNGTDIDKPFFGYNSKTITVNDDSFATEITYKDYYILWIPIKKALITNSKTEEK
ncbi:MAG: hypothetical protein L3J45_08160 [Flavobacteriaceae bacterium]|nr:hypothetical protein [Flavobacteriaceae bacterium]